MLNKEEVFFEPFQTSFTRILKICVKESGVNDFETLLDFLIRIISSFMSPDDSKISAWLSKLSNLSCFDTDSEKIYIH